MINTGIKIGMELPQSVVTEQSGRGRVTAWRGVLAELFVNRC